MDDLVLVEQLEDEVEARAESVEILRTALRHEEDHIFLVLLGAHEAI